ncbi:hypothetical protein AVEN_267271-1, partial [Araneus ventricosus]
DKRKGNKPKFESDAFVCTVEGVQESEVWIAGSEVWITGSEVWITGSEVWITGSEASAHMTKH